MFAKKILIPVTVIALLLSACTDSTDKPQADKSETSVISTTTKSESGQEPNISGFIKKAIKSGKADISAESTSDNEGAGSVITSEDISRMISWKGSFHRDNDDWSFEISKVSDMNISYKFESSENEVLTGTASFDQGGNSAFGKATSDKGFVLEIDKSDNSITIRGSEKLNGVWKKVSNLTMDDLAIDGIRLNMKYNEAAKLLGLKDQLVFDEIPQEDDVPLVKDIQKNGLEMTFYTYSDALDKATLVEIHIKDMQYNTFRGIKIGDSYDKVKSLYQNPDDENKDKISYYLGPFTLSFKLGDGKVKQIDLMSEYG